RKSKQKDSDPNDSSSSSTSPSPNVIELSDSSDEKSTRISTKHLPGWISSTKWKIFIATYEKWVGQQPKPFSIETYDSIKAMQDIYDLMYGAAYPREIDTDDPIFIVAEQWAAEYRHGFTSISYIMLEAYFRLAQDGRDYKIMDNRTYFARAMLKNGQFLYEHNTGTLDDPVLSGAARSVWVARAFAHHLSRTAWALDVPGWVNEAPPLGALILAMTA
ncbi:hypothetical protein CERSUDRAFT_78836, partial [Gelatoporia subvermispora B]